MSNTPNIRFKGFTESWEQRKFGDIGSVSMCKRIFKEETSDDGDIPFYKIGTFGGKPDAYISRELFEEYKEKFSFPEMGDILLSASGTIGRIVEYDGEEAYFQDSNIVWLSHDKSVSNKFLKVLYPTVRWDGIEGSTIQRLYNDNFLKTKFMMPQIEEQEKLGEYFNQLDNIITLHQCKCNEMLELKRFMLQKMFPRNGEQFPEIRFRGFTAPWKQRKVTELGKIFIGLVTTMTEHYTNEGTLLIRNSDIKDGRFEFGENPIYLEETFAQANSSRMHQVGDVITVHTGDVGTSAVISENESNSIGFATIVTRPNTKIIISDYLCTFLNTDKHKKWAVGVSTGDGRTNYNLGDYYECVVPVPSLEEQNKISEYIKNLNNLITLHQRKCDELKDIKKFMLQNMFPKKG